MPARRNSIDMCEITWQTPFEETWYARKKVRNVPEIVHQFMDYLTQCSEGEVFPDELVKNIFITLEEIKKGYLRNFAGYPIPDIFKGKYLYIRACMKYIPLVIDNTESEEFAKCFREEFEELFEEVLPPVNNSSKSFGLRVMEDGGIDISHKNPAEVLTKLYQYAGPSDMTAEMYKPGLLSIETAEKVLQHNNDVYLLLGRYIQVKVKKGVIYTRAYNRQNGWNMAEIAVSQCEDIE